jgi:hypothetical protein
LLLAHALAVSLSLGFAPTTRPVHPAMGANPVSTERCRENDLYSWWALKAL